MIPESERTALLALIQRLEETPAMSPVVRFRKQQVARRRPGVDEPREEWLKGYEKVRPKARFEPRNKRHPLYGDTHFALGFHVRYLDASLDDWFSWAHQVFPITSDRIKIILKRARLLDLRDRFSTAYEKHFAGTWPPPLNRPPSGDMRQDILQDRVPRVEVQIVEIEDQGDGKFSYRFQFCCCDCGGYVIDCPDDDDPEGPAMCKACGQVFGTLGDIKALAQRVGGLKLLQLGLLK